MRNVRCWDTLRPLILAPGRHRVSERVTLRKRQFGRMGPWTTQLHAPGFLKRQQAVAERMPWFT